MRGLSLLVLCLAAYAHAAVPGLTLTWSAPPDCPSEAQLEGAVGHQLGDPAGGAQPPLTVKMRASVVDGNWQVELTNGQGGSRTLNGSSCRAVASAAVVVVALMIDPLAMTDQPPLLSEEPRAPRQLTVGMQFSADTNSLPQLTPGAGLSAGVELAAGFWLEVHAQGWLPQATLKSPGATLTLFAGSLGARRDFTFGPLFLAPVLSLEAGGLRGRSFGVTNPEANVGFWLAARGGLALGLAFGILRVGFRAEAVVPLTRPRFVVEGVGALSTPPFISGRGTFPVELRFPPRTGGGTGN